jgi:RHS repeat-associated protein
MKDCECSCIGPTSVVTGAGTTTLAYDYESRITTITYPNTSTNTFTYNGLDTRVGKADSGGTKTYKRDGIGVTAPVLSDGAASHTPGLSERRSGTSTFSHAGIKNQHEQTAANESSAATQTYDAFGNLVYSSGTWKGPFGYGGSFGYQTDGDSGLKLLGHRYYDSSTGRFLTRDPIQDGRNWYTYCSNSPVTCADPSGLWIWWSLHKWLITGDGFSSDEAYEAGLIQADNSLNDWWGHFVDRNRTFWPAVVGVGLVATSPTWPVSKPPKWQVDGGKGITTTTRRIAVEVGRKFGRDNLVHKVLDRGAVWIKATGPGSAAKLGGLALLYSEVALAIGAGMDTAKDPLVEIYSDAMEPVRRKK